MIGALEEPYRRGTAHTVQEMLTMKNNEAGWDRAARVVLGLGLIALAVVGPQTWLGLLGLVPLVTGLWGFCPIYRVFGLSTCPVPKS